MRALRTILVLVMAFYIGVGPTLAALTSSLLWSIYGGSGNTSNGAGFDPSQTAGMLTNATAATATGNAPVISSVSYSFGSGDVGNWIYIAAGTNWVPGYYKITAVTGGSATVNASIGTAIQIVTINGLPIFEENTVAGCATTANPSGGTFTINYSGPGTASAILSDTTLTNNNSTTLGDTSASFTPVMVGNLIHITAGTGFTLGWYTITAYTSTTSVTIDRAATASSETGGTGAVGGACALLDNINSATAGLGPVAGNIVWIKGSLSETSVVTWAVAGTATSPIKFEGYGTYWSDGYLGRSGGGFGALVTTNFPTLTFSSNDRLTTAAFNIEETLNLTGNGNAEILNMGISNAAKSCVITNADNVTTEGVLMAAECGIIDCDVLMTGATAATIGIQDASAAGFIFGNRITMSSNSATSAAMSVSSSGTIAFNQMVTAGGYGIHTASVSASYGIIFNTINGNAAGVDGINFITGTTNLNFVVANLLTDVTGLPLNAVSTSNPIFAAYNRYRQNTSGGTNSIGNGGTWLQFTNYSPINTVLSATDYVSPPTDNRLLTSSPAKAAAIPVSASIGANQLSAASAGEIDTAY